MAAVHPAMAISHQPSAMTVMTPTAAARAVALIVLLCSDVVTQCDWRHAARARIPAEVAHRPASCRLRGGALLGDAVLLIGLILLLLHARRTARRRAGQPPADPRGLLGVLLSRLRSACGRRDPHRPALRAVAAQRAGEPAAGPAEVAARRVAVRARRRRRRRRAERSSGRSCCTASTSGWAATGRARRHEHRVRRRPLRSTGSTPASRRGCSARSGEWCSAAPVERRADRQPLGLQPVADRAVPRPR